MTDAAIAYRSRIDLVIAGAARAAGLANGELPAAAPGEPADPRGDVISAALGLTLHELDFLWSVTARAVEPRVAAHLRAVYGPDARAGLSLAQHIAMRALPASTAGALLAVLDARHPLRELGLIEPAAADPIDVTARWTTARRVWSYLQGVEDIDPQVAALGGVIDAPITPDLSDEQRAVVTKLRGWLAASASSTTIVLEGAVGSGRRAATALAAAPCPVVAVDFARVAPRAAAGVLTALRREAAMREAIPVLANLDELWSRLPPGDDVALGLALAIDRMTGPVVITTSTPGLELRAQRGIVRARWPLPDVATRQQLWRRALTGVSDEDLESIAVRYALGAGGIADAARSARRHAEQRGDAQLAVADVITGVQDNIIERLGELAQRVDVRQTWSELVLPPDTLDDVRALVARVRHAHFVLDRWGFRQKLARGSGVAALFSGPPGTGKTMVAGLIARELQLELYQVDLSRIVSKWVGETEKQLARVFEAAEAGHALLLFDEADALFAKRSADVKSAVDRYANLEVNYLLQRIESFSGVVVLTTNLDTSIDPALRRRLAGHVVFGLPELEERTRLWREMLPAGVLDEEIDFVALAEEFATMSGANIRNAAIRGAFLAAADGSFIRIEHLHRAAQSEYRAMGFVMHGQAR